MKDRRRWRRAKETSEKSERNVGEVLEKRSPSENWRMSITSPHDRSGLRRAVRKKFAEVCSRRDTLYISTPHFTRFRQGSFSAVSKPNFARNMSWRPLAEIYTTHSFAPFFNLNMSAKNRHHFFANEYMNYLRCFIFCVEFCNFSVRIFDEFFRISRQIPEKSSNVCRFFSQICEKKSEICRKF